MMKRRISGVLRYDDARRGLDARNERRYVRRQRFALRERSLDQRYRVRFGSVVLNERERL